ncbi:MAG: Holliday junction branch migration protein RuvA [Treponema sp.]|nr:Holliday junction branch migration protein RuvA [Candidatus Treponema equi]
MFNSLNGIITGKFPQKLYIDTHGIEWDVTCPDSALEKLPDVGSEGRVFVWMQHTDNLMNLYGFASDRDRSLFFDLLKVDGIGPKGAVKIMNGITTDQLVSILENGDLGLLEKVPGVGKKTAAKMLLQLKGKLTLESDTGSGPSKKAASPYADVISALVDMGYDKAKAGDAVAKIAETLASDESFAKSGQSQKEDLIFRRAIVELAN